jgi:hypothetical protein
MLVKRPACGLFLMQQDRCRQPAVRRKLEAGVGVQVVGQPIHGEPRTSATATPGRAFQFLPPPANYKRLPFELRGGNANDSRGADF